MKLPKKQLIKKITQNKRNCNHKNGDHIHKKKGIKIKWLGMKSKNKIQLKKKIKSKINRNQKNNYQIW
jgi:hypothetical protein